MSQETSTFAFTVPWLNRMQQRINADPEMEAIGDWFTTAFSLTCGEGRYILRLNEANWSRSRNRLVSMSVARLASGRVRRSGRSSSQRSRQPLYHDFFAMLMRVPGFVLEGDTLVAMQNARALHRAMNVMRTVQPS